MTERETSSTKWGRTFIDNDLLYRIRLARMDYGRVVYKIASGISHTIYPDCLEKKLYLTDVSPYKQR